MVLFCYTSLLVSFTLEMSYHSSNEHQLACIHLVKTVENNDLTVWEIFDFF